jgi:hypothetical protein
VPKWCASTPRCWIRPRLHSALYSTINRTWHAPQHPGVGPCCRLQTVRSSGAVALRQLPQELGSVATFMRRGSCT